MELLSDHRLIHICFSIQFKIPSGLTRSGVDEMKGDGHLSHVQLQGGGSRPHPAASLAKLSTFHWSNFNFVSIQTKFFFNKYNKNLYMVYYGFRLFKRDDFFFKSLLITLDESVIFLGCWGCSKNWLEPKTKSPQPSLTKLKLSKSLAHSLPLCWTCRKKVLIDKC